jgi:glutamate dehydrogenase
MPMRPPPSCAGLTEENFVLLGHRRFTVAPDGAIGVVAEENLGLLTDPALPVFDALRDLSAIPPAVRATLSNPTPVTVAKANMRATVHRPQHADVVATRIFDKRGACGRRAVVPRPVRGGGV